MCGVFGIRSVEREVARLSYFALFALQHRGQESAGIAVSEGGRLTALRDMGLVAQVFNEQQLQALPGEVAIGHTRYSTTGGVHWSNAQPLVHHGRARTVALGHNGNLTNAGALRDELVADGVRLGSTSDTEVIAALIARDPAPLPEAVAATMRRLEGAYSVVAIVDGTMVAFRDPHGIRPLVLGRIGDDWVVASESCALDLIGAVVDRDVRPGEVLWLDEDGLHSAQALPEGRGAACIFEHVYFARPDSRLGGTEVHASRVRMGQRLAEEAPAEADLVMPIPDSGTPAAIGFAKASGIPYEEGLIKNRYVGRTFIQPDQELRRAGDPAQVQPARRDRRAARRHRRRLDRARQHDAPARRDALRRGRGGGARPHLVAAGRLPVLLRDRHGRRGGARRRAPLGGGDAGAHRRDVAALPLARRHAGGDADAGGLRLPRVLHAAATRRRCPRRDVPSCGSRWWRGEQPRRPAEAGHRGARVPVTAPDTPTPPPASRLPPPTRSSTASAPPSPRPTTPGVAGAFGAFAGLFAIDDRRLLAASTDSVGSKLVLGRRGDRLRWCGADLAAHCINDVLTTGAEPLFFLDYVAANTIDVEQVAELVEGAADVCRAAGCAILGGETAELPGIYRDEELDFCGTAVGIVERDRLIDGSRIEAGDVVLGFPSAGIHANGFSLVRRIVGDGAFDADLLLPPTRLYLDDVRALRGARRRAWSRARHGRRHRGEPCPHPAGRASAPSSTRAPGSGRRCSAGWPSTASRRTSCGASSTSGSGTAPSSRRPTSTASDLAIGRVVEGDGVAWA